MKPKTLVDLFQYAIETHSHFDFSLQHESEETLSYQDIKNLAMRCQSALTNKKSPVVLYIHHTPSWVVSFFATICCSRLVIILDPTLPIEMILNQLQFSQAGTVITEEENIPILQKLIQEGKYTNTDHDPIEFLSIESIPSYPPSTAGLPQPSPADDALVIFTSGSSGNPLGVVHTHASVCHAVMTAMAATSAPEHCVLFAFPPFYHILGLTCTCLAGMLSGAKFIYVRTMKPTIIQEAIKKHNVAVLLAPPIFYNLIYKNIIKKINQLPGVRKKIILSLLAISSLLRKISKPCGRLFAKTVFKKIRTQISEHLDLMISGGASIDPVIVNGFIELGFNLRNGYGLSETCGAVTLCDPFDPREGSVGRCMNGNELTISHPDSQGIGEILIKSKQNMARYYRKPELTKEVIGEDGWLKTGDLGSVKDGYLYISGRSKEVIINLEGKKIYPGDIENYFQDITALHHKGRNEIHEFCVFGLQQGLHQDIAIVIALDDDPYFKENSAQVTKFIKLKNSSLPPHMKVQHIFIHKGELPKTAVKKIKRFQLAEHYKHEKNTSSQ